MSVLKGLFVVLWVSGVQAVERPNVLFLSIDDLKPELGCYGADYMVTPAIDRLAELGMLFEHHYVQQAVCGPSRASMFSGLRPDTTRVWDLQHTCREECPTAFTMQEYFKKAGYETAGAGKIMHGFKHDDPPSWSIPYVQGEALPFADDRLPAHYTQYQSPHIHQAEKQMKRGGRKTFKEKQAFMAQLDAKPSTEMLDLPDDAYSDGAMTVWGIEMLEQLAESDKPFFLTLGYRKPHLPFVAPKKYWDLYDRGRIELAAYRELPEGSPRYAWHKGTELRGYSDVKRVGDIPTQKQRELIHGYRACVSYVDTQIGKVIDKLVELGLHKNTVVVLWGDHGWHLGDHNIWCKHSTYEQATRAPLIIYSPTFLRPGKTRSVVESVDIFPTLCELASLPIPQSLEGTSLVPLLKNPDGAVKPFAMSQYPDHGKRDKMGYSLRTERYRAVFWVDRAAAQTGTFEASRVHARELFDYQTDPLEQQNRAEDRAYKTVMDQFERYLSDYFSSGFQTRM